MQDDDESNNADKDRILKTEDGEEMVVEYEDEEY